jgi:protein-tyrosine phosphatase
MRSKILGRLGRMNRLNTTKVTRASGPCLVRKPSNVVDIKRVFSIRHRKHGPEFRVTVNMTSQADIPASKPDRPPVPEGRKIWTRFSIFMVLMVIATCAVYWYMVIQTYHLAVVKEGVLYRDGNRDLREFKHAVTMMGARTVVSLIDDKELNDPKKKQFLAETNYCTANAIQYIRIPVKLGGWPTTDDLQTFMAIVSNPKNQPVLVHCAQGVRRTGMFVAAYQETVMKQQPNEVKGEILTFKHKPQDVDDVRKFIDLYQPRTMTLPATMPASGSE